MKRQLLWRVADAPPVPQPSIAYDASLLMTGIRTINLGCGATLVVEPILNVSSCAMSWLVPVGSATDTPDGDGQATMLSELIFRGAGGFNSRDHSDALDRLGVQRSSQVLTHHLRLGSVVLGSRLAEALPLVTAMLCEPAIPDDALEAVRRLCLQTLDSLEDEPQRSVMLRLRERHLPAPFNRHGHGKREVLERCSIQDLRNAWTERCTPAGTIIAAAGNVDGDALAEQLNELMSDWSGTHNEPVELSPAVRGQHHDQQDTAQVHIALAYDAPQESDPSSMLERVAVAVLSGGTSGRLFTELRQKRSLCYSVGASLYAGRDRGLVTVYVGTTPERANESLKVCKDEIRRLLKGVCDDEFTRAVLGLKSHLIMQGESTTARAAAIGQDQYRLDRTRTLEQMARAIDAITVDQLNAYLGSRDLGEFTTTTIGAVPVAESC